MPLGENPPIREDSGSTNLAIWTYRRDCGEARRRCANPPLHKQIQGRDTRVTKSSSGGHSKGSVTSTDVCWVEPSTRWSGPPPQRTSVEMTDSLLCPPELELVARVSRPLYLFV